MAKKEKKIEVINQEVEVLTTNPMAKEVVNTETSIDRMSLKDLVYADKAIRVVCKEYENSLKSYDGTILRNSSNYTKFQTLSVLHNKILNKMESELLKLL